jgi:single-stranded-DNA-specific exonuclease
MPKTWITPKPLQPSAGFQKSIGGHPLVARRLFERGFKDIQSALCFLDPTVYVPSPPTELPNLSKAVVRIVKAIRNHEPILVWGDFDVDGQTATTLLVQALGELGAIVRYHIPIRAIEGHGIQSEVLERFLERDPKPKLIITCDTGISEHGSIELANSRGVDVIITDHHELPETLPNAHAVVNTHLLPRNHPLCSLPGVGVVYKLIEELSNIENKIPDLRHYLDLVALGIVSDVAELTEDTRYLLQLGLNELRNTSRLGIRILYEITGINANQVNEDHIGFTIGPRLNALGRLSDANPVVEFLLTDNLNHAQLFANQLDGLNHRRKLLTDQVYQGAISKIEQDSSLLNTAALVLAHPGWPTGILGIVASRLVEKFGIPSFLFTIQDGIRAIGSARSIEGVNIKDAIAAQSDLLVGFGGHAGAAGLSLPAKDIQDFRVRISRTIRRMSAGKDLTPKQIIDGFITLSELSIDLLDDIERLAPFGAGNPPLVLACKDLTIINHARIGSTREHLKVVVEDPIGNVQEVLWWHGFNEILPDSSEHFDLAFIPKSNIFGGERKLQLQWVDYRPHESSVMRVKTPSPSIEVIDYRNNVDPHQLLETIRLGSDFEIWAEGNAVNIVKGLNRTQLHQAHSLIIWTTPPGYRELQSVIEKVKPDMVYLFSVNPEIDGVQAFLARLAGLVKHVLKDKDGEINLLELAANLAHKEGTVRMGLFWLEAKGIIRISYKSLNEETNLQIIKIANGSNVARPELAEITNELKIMLEETAAFRKYFESTKPEALILSRTRELDNLYPFLYA